MVLEVGNVLAQGQFLIMGQTEKSRTQRPKIGLEWKEGGIKTKFLFVFRCYEEVLVVSFAREMI